MKNDNENGGGKLIVSCAQEHVDQIADWIRDTLAHEPIEITEVKVDHVLLEVYFGSEVEAQIAAKSFPASLPALSVEAEAYEAQDWTTFWQHHFEIVEIGRRMRIVPEWKEVPDDQKINIIINPGLSFGTGGHFTTRFCLEALEQSIEEMEPESIIDAGTGSGIIAIAAAKFGVQNLAAFDYDPISIENCLENAQKNGVTNCIDFFVEDVLSDAWFSSPVDLICCNILTSVLVQAAPQLKQATRKRLVLSGIRVVEIDEILAAFTAIGFKEVRRDDDGQWCGLVLDH